MSAAASPKRWSMPFEYLRSRSWGAPRDPPDPASDPRGGARPARPRPESRPAELEVFEPAQIIVEVGLLRQEAQPPAALVLAIGSPRIHAWPRVGLWSPTRSLSVVVLPGAVGAEVTEHLTASHLEVQIGDATRDLERPGIAIELGEPARADGGFVADSCGQDCPDLGRIERSVDEDRIGVAPPGPTATRLSRRLRRGGRRGVQSATAVPWSLMWRSRASREGYCPLLRVMPRSVVLPRPAIW